MYIVRFQILKVIDVGLNGASLLVVLIAVHHVYRDAPHDEMPRSGKYQVGLRRDIRCLQSDRRNVDIRRNCGGVILGG